MNANAILTVEISERAARSLNEGSLWIFSNEFKTRVKLFAPGQWVHFQCRGRHVGSGYVNPHSLICGRVLSLAPVTKQDLPTLFQARISEALKRRTQIDGSFRAVFSEADLLPGLIVDVYVGGPASRAKQQPIVIAQSTTAGMDALEPYWKKAVIDLLNPRLFLNKSESSMRALEGLEPKVESIIGSDSDWQNEAENGFIREGDLLLACDFVGGQKTGFFLDQRENRQHLTHHAQSKRVLDLCCYSGGWGLSALHGGAQFVTFVDQSQEALALVKRGLALNGFSESRAEFIHSDVFEFLEKSQHGSYDIAICDPPAFVKSKKNLPQALKAYQKLNRLAIRRVRSSGILYTCSCSFHVSSEQFELLVAEAMKHTRCRGRALYRGGQGLDHPWILNMPETHYLKCLAVEIQSIS